MCGDFSRRCGRLDVEREGLPGRKVIDVVKYSRREVLYYHFLYARLFISFSILKHMCHVIAHNTLLFFVVVMFHCYTRSYISLHTRFNNPSSFV